MEDVFDVLAEDHEEIRQVLAELEKGPTAATGATEDQLMLRQIMTEELIIEQSKHEEIELTCLWPAVREHVPGGDRLADRVICAELEIVTLLAELDKLDVSRRPSSRCSARSPRRAGSISTSRSGTCGRGCARPCRRAAGELGRKVLLARQAVPVLPFPRHRSMQWPVRPAGA